MISDAFMRQSAARYPRDKVSTQDTDSVFNRITHMCPVRDVPDRHLVRNVCDAALPLPHPTAPSHFRFR